MFEIKGFGEDEKTARAEIEKEYQEKIQLIAMRVKGPLSFVTKFTQCKRLFDWFCENTRYDYNILKNKKENGAYKAIEYTYKNIVITSNEKYAAVLLGKGDALLLQRHLRMFVICFILTARLSVGEIKMLFCQVSELHTHGMKSQLMEKEGLWILTHILEHT